MSVCAKCHRDAPEGALFCAFCGASIEVARPGAPDPLIGLTIGGKYLIQQLLGRGGMGDVYKANHLTLDRPVVLKLLKKLFQSDPALVQRFHREARAASRLNHPNSITVIDFGQTDDGTLFIAMEYLAGRSLERVIADEHPLGEDRVVHIGAQILAALSEAHALGIIHRDLKPANVMIESRLDESDFVKVLDFGIAKLSGPGTGGTGITQAGIVCGTPGYMSPEQVRGERLDARSDLYAVGVILYEMITGLLPFQSMTPMGLVTKHLVEDPTPIKVRNPNVSVSAPLESLVMRALARKREERFASSGEMRAALLSCAPGAGAGQSLGSVSRPMPVLELTTLSEAEAAEPESSSSASVEQVAVADVTEDVPVSGSSYAHRSRRRVRIIVGAIGIAIALAAAASWAVASGRFGRGAGGAGAPLADEEPAARIVAEPEAASPSIAAGSPKVPPGTEAKAPEAAAVPTEPAPGVPEPAPAPPPTAETTPPAAVPRKSKAAQAAAPAKKKGVKQVGGQLNSIRTPSVSSGEGVLTVLASPWAMVSIDGREIGETPREVRLGAGRYLVRATHPALGGRERVISVKPGKRQTWNPSFGR